MLCKKTVYNNLSLELNLSKLRAEDVLWTSSKEVLLTFPYGPLCKVKGHPLPMSRVRLLQTF